MKIVHSKIRLFVSTYKQYLILFFLVLIIIPLGLFLIKNSFLKPKTIPTKIHAVTKFDRKTIQSLAKADILTGKAIPNAKVQVLLTPNGEIKDLTANKGGMWSYTIPPNLNNKKYHFTVIVLDRLSNLASIRSYPVLISSAFIKTSINIWDLFKIKDVKADDLIRGPEYDSWVNQMHVHGIYPMEEDGEIMLYSREQYLDKFCRQGCVENLPSTKEYVNRILSNSSKKDFLQRLAYKLKDGGYAPMTAMEPYFPNIREAAGFRYIPPERRLPGTPPDIDGGPLIYGKTEISEEELSQYIRETSNEVGWERTRLQEAYGDPMKALVTVTDPIFGTKAIVDVLSLPPSQVTNETRINALLGMSFIYGLSEKVTTKGLKIASNSIVDLKNLIRDTQIIQRDLQLAPIPLQGVRSPIASRFGSRIRGQTMEISQRPQGSLFHIVRNNQGFSVAGRTGYWNQEELARVFPNDRKPLDRILVAPGYVPLRGPQKGKLQSIFANGGAAVISRQSVLDPAIRNLASAVYDFSRRTGRNLTLNVRNIDDLLRDGMGYIVDYNYMGQLHRSAAGYFNPAGRYVVISSRHYYSINGLGILHHELTHLISRDLRKGWSYGGTGTKDGTLTAIYELFTDAWSDLARGIDPIRGTGMFSDAYGGGYRNVYNGLMHRIRYNPRLFDDCLEFALTGDAETLISAFEQNPPARNFLDRHFGGASIDTYHFTEYFKKALGIDLTRMKYGARYASMPKVQNLAQNSDVAGISTEETTDEEKTNEEFPTLETEGDGEEFAEVDIDFEEDAILDNYEAKDAIEYINEDIQIIGIEGELKRGGTLDVSAIITSDGIIEVDPENFRVTYILEKANPQSGIFIKNVLADESIESINEVEPLAGSENCTESCRIELPENLAAGEYKLIGLLHIKDSDKVLDSDSESIAVAEPDEPPSPEPSEETEASAEEEPTPEPKQVVGIEIDNQEVDLDNLSLDLHLPGTEGQAGYFSIPIEIHYSDDTSRYLILNFSYQPPSQDQCPNWQFLENECADCGVARSIEQDSCSGDTRISQEGVSDEGCLGSDWCEQTNCSWNFLRNECTGCNEARSVEVDSCSGETRISEEGVYDSDCESWCQTNDCITSCGINNGQNCSDQNKADTECAEYYNDSSTCSFTDEGPRGDGCIP